MLKAVVRDIIMLCLNKEDGKLSVRCDCAAGEWGKSCKHKTKLINNDISMLYNQTQSKGLGSVQLWVEKSGYASLYKQFEQHQVEKKQLEQKYKKLKKTIDLKLHKLPEIVPFDEFKILWAEVAIVEQSIAYNAYLTAKEKGLIEQQLKNGF